MLCRNGSAGKNGAAAGLFIAIHFVHFFVHCPETGLYRHGTGGDIRPLPDTDILALPLGAGATRLIRPGTRNIPPETNAGISAADNKYPVENGTGSC